MLSAKVFNTTFYVERQLADRLLSWLRLTYIPEAMASGMITDVMLMRLSEPPDPSAEAFALHLRTHDSDGAKEWINNIGQSLIGHLAAEVGQERLLHFTTPMEEIEI